MPAGATAATGQLALINQDRAGTGRPPLAWNNCLASVAGENALRVAAANQISHVDGPRQDLRCYLGSYGGENVAGPYAGGQNDAVFNTAFMNSVAHYDDIMGICSICPGGNANWRFVGAAWAQASNGAWYMAVEFS